MQTKIHKLADKYILIHKTLKELIKYLKEDGYTYGAILRMLNKVESKQKKLIKKNV